MELTINGQSIGDDRPTYVVAEIGQNHNGDAYTAIRLAGMANACGADAVKFCKRDLASELTAAAAARPYDNRNSFGATYGEHRAALELSEPDYKTLKQRIEYNEWRVTMFATACDIPSVELLERVGVPAYKVASRDIDNHPLLREIALTRKPVIISTGMSDMEEIEDAIKAIESVHNRIVLLHCTSAYPTKNEDVNLRVIPELRKCFGHLVGLSDHTPGIDASVAAVHYGACMIEKHITFSRAARGTDHAGSLEQEGLRRLVQKVRIAEQQRGDETKQRLPAVRPFEDKLRRSLVARRDIASGETVTEADVCLKSPGTGVGWRHRHAVIGHAAKVDIAADTTISTEWVV